MSLTLQALLNKGAARLEAAGVPEPWLDARLLLLHVCQLDISRWFLEKDCPLGENDSRLSLYDRYIERRAARVPVQQILGSQFFMGLEFKVNEHVLVPRQDTETLVELVLQENRDRNISILDMCTGSGCIGVSLAALGRYEHITAVDISGKAIQVAEENAKRLLQGSSVDKENHGRSFQLIQSDLFENIPKRRQFDILVSNPPYIPSQTIEELEPEVKDHEPRMALDGSRDGLAFYRRIAEECNGVVKAGGKIYLEIGFDQAEAVTGILRQSGFKEIEVKKDLAGHDRVVKAVNGC